ncbi:DMT family transporter [Paenibacillus sp. 481]|nr:DMT family transporter [Paenibacillus sp. 481]
MKAQQWFTHPVGMAVSATLATLLWGSAMPAIKIGYEALGIGSAAIYEQWVFAGYRFTLAGLLLVLFAAVVDRSSNAIDATGGAAKSGRSLSIWALRGNIGWRVTRLAAVQTFLQYIFFYIGLSLSTGMKGAIITGATSLFQMVIARMIDRSETFTPAKTFGLTLGFAGVAIVTLNQGGLTMSLNIGDLCLLVSALFGACGNVLARHEARQLPVLWLTGRQMLLGGIGLTVIGAWKAGIAPFQWDAATIGLLTYLAFLSAAGFSLWNLVMKYNRVSTVSMFLFLIPVFGVLLSAWLLDEVWNVWTFVALFLVVAGIVVVNRASVVRTVNKDSRAAS